MKHQIKFRVYYEDTDAGKVVFYGNYLRFAERARTEWLREIGFNQSELDIFFVVRHVEIDYLSPARLDDEIHVETELQNISRASITMTQNFYKGETALAKMKVVLVTVNHEIRPVAIPQNIKDKLK
jgi:acyl-CoA thioester hydrolase